MGARWGGGGAKLGRPPLENLPKNYSLCGGPFATFSPCAMGGFFATFFLHVWGIFVFMMGGGGRLSYPPQNLSGAHEYK